MTSVHENRCVIFPGRQSDPAPTATGPFQTCTNSGYQICHVRIQLLRPLVRFQNCINIVHQHFNVRIQLLRPLVRSIFTCQKYHTNIVLTNTRSGHRWIGTFVVLPALDCCDAARHKIGQSEISLTEHLAQPTFCNHVSCFMLRQTLAPQTSRTRASTLAKRHLGSAKFSTA